MVSTLKAMNAPSLRKERRHPKKCLEIYGNVQLFENISRGTVVTSSDFVNKIKEERIR